MLVKFQNHIKTRFRQLTQNSKLLVAVSGGIDSVVLCNLLKKNNYNFSIAHCNFQIRGEESKKDRIFVENLAKTYKVPFFKVSFDILNYAKKEKTSIQVAARDLRHKWFFEIQNIFNYHFILTAHHLDDALETFIINIGRASGIEGLLGIPEENKTLIRPLLIFTKEEIFEYAKENNIWWREDTTNEKRIYLRNKIRHSVIPIWKNIAPNLLYNFNNTLNYLKQSNDIINDAVEKLKKDIFIKKKKVFYIKLLKLKKIKHLKSYLFEIFKIYGFREVEDLLSLMQAQTGKYLESNTHQLLKDRNYLILKPLQKNIESIHFIPENRTKLKTPILLTLKKQVNEKFTIDKTNVVFDRKKIRFPLILRKIQKGDIFHPFGMKGKKKVSKFYKDEKFSMFDKQNQWLLCSEYKVIWIIGHRTDRKFVADEKTKKKLYISTNLEL